MNAVLKKLKSMQDKKYLDFQANLIPNVDKSKMIGVRTPDLKKYAKELANTKYGFKFISELPHKYFDENQLHAFIISETKDFDECVLQVEKFLPYVDNWATCDQLSPKCFKKNKDKLIKYINKWIKSKKAFTVRFAIEMLMSHFLDEDYDKKYLDMVAKVNFKSIYDKVDIKLDYNKYYVEMMVAWYFATALAKQYDDAFKYIKLKKLNPWTHNKTIQKAIESFRVTESHKTVLKSLRIK